MRVAVLGGKLQGVEAAYLAGKAGWHVILVDKNGDAPAVGMCDEFYQFDLTDKDKLLELLGAVDFVVPALEKKYVLDTIYECACAAGVKVVYDPKSYLLSSSKLESNKLFAEWEVPSPKPWPLCNFPVTVKPSGASGSKNVCQIASQKELDTLMNQLDDKDNWVIEEFLSGPSYSIEVVGCNGDYRTFQVTELAMDEEYDCKRVLSPSLLSDDKINQFTECALTIARKIKLNGIMDVEVILHDAKLKVLEIDARLPSQTLTAVYKSTGVNVLGVLWSGFGGKNEQTCFTAAPARGVIYEHIKVSGQQIEICGEHIMGNGGPLHLFKDFFGADEAISNYSEDKTEWVATLIITGENRGKAWQRREKVIHTIMDYYGIQKYRDMAPPMLPECKVF